METKPERGRVGAGARGRTRRRLNQLLPGHLSEIRQGGGALGMGELDSDLLRAARVLPDVPLLTLEPLSAIAPRNSPLASGEAVRVWLFPAPADCPPMVTFAGSPPNAAILS